MEPLIQIQKISKQYLIKKEVKEALKEISLEMFEGEVMGLLGVNGAGKTTLSSIIATLLKPSSGDILWNNKSIYSQVLDYRKVIGFCPQKPNLDPELNVWNLLCYSGRYYGLHKKEVEKRAEELIKVFGLEKYQYAKVSILSGGYKQRFLLARSLVHFPKLVLLDEPTVGLDPQVRRQLWEYIRLLKKEKVTVILTTHYLDEAEALCDRVCIIDRGKMMIIDTPDNLKSSMQKSNLESVFLKLIEQEEEHE